MPGFTLRPWSEADLPDLMRFANNAGIARFMSNKFIHPYTEAQGKRFIAYTGQHDPLRILAIELESQAAGAIGIHPQEDVYCKNAELGYWLAEPYWGKGIMTRVVKEMVQYGFAHFELDRIFARPFGSNVGSQRVLEKAGFTLEAKFAKTIFKNDQYEDEWVYGIRRSHS